MLVYFILLPISSILAQTNPPDGEETKVAVDGKIYSALITPDGDTLILTDLDGLQITALRKFGSDDEYKSICDSVTMLKLFFPMQKKLSGFSENWNTPQIICREEKEKEN